MLLLGDQGDECMMCKIYVSFCSIGWCSSLKLCGEAKTHFSKTQKLFMEIPPRDSSIKLIDHRLIFFPKCNLGKLVNY